MLYGGHPRLLMNRLMLRINELASNRGTTSKLILRHYVHVNEVTFCSGASLSVFESKFNFTYNGPKL